MKHTARSVNCFMKTMRPALLLLALLAPAVAGCAALASQDPENDRTAGVLYGEDGGAEGGQTIGPTSPEGGDASDLRGNALCKAGMYSSCFPDDTKSQYCAILPGDAGADGATGASACHVTQAGPECTVSGAAAEGEACSAASDCAAGFECVGTPARCRRYCCEASTCAVYAKAIGRDYFCDVQPLASATSTLVPVCQPVTPCTLLGDNCGAGQTCALVDANKSLTSCVSVGPGKTGESCASQHCGAGLQCIGNPAVCHRLCDPKNPGCPINQQCFLGWPVLQQQGVGVCQ